MEASLWISIHQITLGKAASELKPIAMDSPTKVNFRVRRLILDYIFAAIASIKSNLCNNFIAHTFYSIIS